MSQSDTLRAYLNEVGKYPLLTTSQEIELSRRVQRWVHLRDEKRELTKAEQREMKSGEPSLQDPQPVSVDEFTLGVARLPVRVVRYLDPVCCHPVSGGGGRCHHRCSLDYSRLHTMALVLHASCSSPMRKMHSQYRGGNRFAALTREKVAIVSRSWYFPRQGKGS